MYVEETDDGHILRFESSTDADNVPFELEYNKSLIQFQPNLSIANQVGEVTVIGWDKENKEQIKCTAKRDQILTKGHERFKEAFEKRKEFRTMPPVESRAEACRLATQTLEDIAKEMITATGALVGLPELRAGKVAHIRGLGQLFSGRYFVTATTHTIGDSGYTTQFECRKEET
jgi:phage protein D